MSLVDDGTLSLDDTAAKSLPEFRNDPKSRASIRQILSHTSGYQPYQPENKPVDNYQESEPGERFEYGGLAYFAVHFQLLSRKQGATDVFGRASGQLNVNLAGVRLSKQAGVGSLKVRT